MVASKEKNVEEVLLLPRTCGAPPARVAPGEYVWEKVS